MRIKEIELSDFRNFSQEKIYFPKRVTHIIGSNGHGKTSLLEAIFMLAHAKSFRCSDHKELINWQSQEKTAKILGTVSSSDGDRSIEVRINHKKKTALVNNNPIHQATSFYGQFICVVFTPDDLMLVKGSPSIRRKFIDRLLVMVNPLYVETSVKYQRALKHRNSILSGIFQGKSKVSELDPWDIIFAEAAQELVHLRLSFVETIYEMVKIEHQQIVKNSKHNDFLEKINLKYESSLIKNNAVLDKKEIIKLFLLNREKDIRKGATSIGPNHDDLIFEIDCGSGFHQARHVASQGQARSISLALVLSAVKYLNKVNSEPPVVLLDDVESELDQERRDALDELLEQINSQVLITSTEAKGEKTSEMLLDKDIINVVSGRLKISA